VIKIGALLDSHKCQPPKMCQNDNTIFQNVTFFKTCPVYQNFNTFLLTLNNRLGDEMSDDDDLGQDAIEIIDLDDLEPEELEQEFQVVADDEEVDENDDEMEGASGLGLEATREDNSVLVFDKHESKNWMATLTLEAILNDLNFFFKDKSDHFIFRAQPIEIDCIYFIFKLFSCQYGTGHTFV
jgi:hypothetical protein